MMSPVRIARWRAATSAFALAGVVLATAHCSTAATGSKEDEAALLVLHRDGIAAHLQNDVDRLLAPESDDYVLVNRGEVSHPDKKARASSLGPYLQSVRFERYADAIEPIVKVSPDGRLGWVIAQVEVKGAERTKEGAGEPLEFVSAWIELYEKRGDRWYRIGNVSNFKE
jgi:hypothetical protein